MGLANTMARLGSITAPLVKMAGEVFPALPLVIYGAAPVVSGLVALFLPETRDTALPETVEEVEGRWGGVHEWPQGGDGWPQGGDTQPWGVRAGGHRVGTGGHGVGTSGRGVGMGGRGQLAGGGDRGQGGLGGVQQWADGQTGGEKKRGTAGG